MCVIVYFICNYIQRLLAFSFNIQYLILILLWESHGMEWKGQKKCPMDKPMSCSSVALLDVRHNVAQSYTIVVCYL